MTVVINVALGILLTDDPGIVIVSGAVCTLVVIEGDEAEVAAAVVAAAVVAAAVVAAAVVAAAVVAAFQRQPLLRARRRHYCCFRCANAADHKSEMRALVSTSI